MMLMLSFALAMLVTSVALPLVRRHADRLGLIDVPTETRSVHTQSIAHSGGLAILAGVTVAVASWLPKDIALAPLLGCMGLIALLGLLDDLRDLSHRTKFAGQILASVAFLAVYGGFPNLPFMPLDGTPALLSLAFSFVFLLGVTNAVNLSDGLDGLAAGNSLLSLIVLALFAAQSQQLAYVVLTLAIAGGLVGFLRFNTHPATIFMGDTGSQFLGFAGAALAILIVQNEQLPFGALVPVLIFGLPILDTLSVMAIRKWRRRPMFSADRSHLHHQLLHLGFRHYEVVIVLYVLQAICVGTAYQLRYAPDWLVLLSYLTFCITVMGLVLLARMRGWQAHAAELLPDRERRNMLLRQLAWYHHNTARVIAPVIGAFMLVSSVAFGSEYPVLHDNAWVLALTSIGVWLVLRKQIDLVARIICYAAAPIAVYCTLFSEHSPEFVHVGDTFVVILALALALAIRVTRRTLFHLDSQDYLVLLIVAAAPMLMPEDIQGILAARVVVYLAVVLYACEYVISKGKKTRGALSAVALLSLIVLAA